MTRTLETTTADAATPSQRRARGVALIVGAVVLLAFIQTGVIAYYWLPLTLGVTYLVAAIASRSSGTLWAPGLIITVVGISIALWFRDGRPIDFEFLALTVLSIGLGAALASGLAQLRHVTIGAMSIAVPVLLLGAFLLAEQREINYVAGDVWVYAAGLLLWGAYELRPARG